MALRPKASRPCRVAVISGGAWPQFEKQLLSHLPHDKRLLNLSLLPTCGTKLFRYAGAWQTLYSEDFTADDKQRIVSSFNEALGTANYTVERVCRSGPAGAPGGKRQMGPRLHEEEEDQKHPGQADS